MSKTSPVRWWRDDATRYVTRGPQLVPAAQQPDLQWAFDLVASGKPGLTEILERYNEMLATAPLTATSSRAPGTESGPAS